MANSKEIMLPPVSSSNEWLPVMHGGEQHVQQDPNYEATDYLIVAQTSATQPQLKENLGTYLETHSSELLQGDTWQSKKLMKTLEVIERLQAQTDAKAARPIITIEPGIDSQERKAKQQASEELLRVLGFEYQNESMTPDYSVAQHTSALFPGVEILRLASRENNRTSYIVGKLNSKAEA